MTKRTLSVLLALCLLLSAAAPAVAANDDGAALTPLAAPSNLRWSRDGAWGPGEMTWDIDGAFQGKLDKAEILGLIRTVGLDERIRGERLTLEAFAMLSDAAWELLAQKD